MSGVRVLVGTRKGAFILTSDGRRKSWDVSGPHFGGWEIYHLKGSPVDPNRIYASQSSGWFGQLIQRSDDGGKTWAAGGQQIRVRRRRPARICGTTARRTRGSSSASGISNRRSPIPTRFTPASKMRRSFAPTDGGQNLAGTVRPAHSHDRFHVAARRRRHVPAHDSARSAQSAAHLHRDLGGRRLSQRRRRRNVAADQPRAAHPNISPIPTPRSATACIASPCMPRGRTCSSCRSTGT